MCDDVLYMMYMYIYIYIYIFIYTHTIKCVHTLADMRDEPPPLSYTHVLNTCRTISADAM